MQRLVSKKADGARAKQAGRVKGSVLASPAADGRQGGAPDVKAEQHACRLGALREQDAQVGELDNRAGCLPVDGRCGSAADDSIAEGAPVGNRH